MSEEMETAEGGNEKPENAGEEEAPEETGADDGAMDGTEDDPEDYVDRIADLEAEAADLKDKLLRALAEAENVRRRAVRDKEDASKYAITNFARDILAVADNLRRALDSVTSGKDENNGPVSGEDALASLLTGVEMTERDMLGIFERHGIKAIEAMGAAFDHNLHEAMFELEDAEKPAGTVVHEMQTGYKLGDRLLRPTKVGLSKGGPKTAVKKEPKPEEAAQEKTAAYEKQDETPGGKVNEEL